MMLQDWTGGPKVEAREGKLCLGNWPFLPLSHSKHSEMCWGCFVSVPSPGEQVVLRAVGSRWEGMVGVRVGRGMKRSFLCLVESSSLRWSLWESGSWNFVWEHAGLSLALRNHLHTFLSALPLKRFTCFNWVYWNFQLDEEGIGTILVPKEKSQSTTVCMR